MKKMKKTFNIFVLLFATISCKSQIRDISDLGWNTPHGFYYKDNQNLLDPFVGTYIYTEGNTMLKIVLQKKVMSSARGLYHEDLIIGEYQYIKDGIEKVNTLSRLNENFADGVNYSIDGNCVIGHGSPGCRECSISEKALQLGMVDRLSNDTAFLYVRRVTVNGQAAIKIFIWWRMKAVKPTETLIPTNIPGGRDYILLKQ
jgi:hypothetical protein